VSHLKSILKGIPPRQPSEEPASQKQLGYLRSFGYFSEKQISNLGMWQASYLIDKAVAMREIETEREIKGSERLSARTTRGNGSGCLLLIAVIVGGFFLIRSCSKTEDTNTGTEVTELPQPHIKLDPVATAEPKDQEVDPKIKPREEPELIPLETAEPLSTEINSFEQMTFPVSVIVTKPITLLDRTGKDTLIPADSTLKIVSRGKKGTLTVDWNGVVFVGNEDRLFLKVKLP
jgi:hypothetical protein